MVSLYFVHTLHVFVWLLCPAVEDHALAMQRELQALKQKHEVEKARRKNLHNALVVSAGLCTCPVSCILSCSEVLFMHRSFEAISVSTVACVPFSHLMPPAGQLLGGWGGLALTYVRNMYTGLMLHYKIWPVLICICDAFALLVL